MKVPASPTYFFPTDICVGEQEQKKIAFVLVRSNFPNDSLQFFLLFLYFCFFGGMRVF
jgi:hypothetical protein